ncbi:unnamed protein product [Enterobius vermicularis]|uniref:serine--tRNA ligase n=1 Tax=Enterobius vermicularis TaxID=51028 RepID=A0A0N4V9X0_ENTVE|nr:unnamed protein product [Enterobius vermicularis]
MVQLAVRRLLIGIAASNAQCLPLYSQRPELDFDFILDKSNLEVLKKNIQVRKGVGNIELVHSLWQQIREFPKKSGGTEEEYKWLWDKLYQEALLIPNMCHPDVPTGPEAAAKVVREFGGDRREGSSLVTAEIIGNYWKSVIYPREACGNRSYAFIGPLAELERALIRYVWNFVLAKGFRPVIVSDIVPAAVTEACGLQQRSGSSIKYVLEQDKSLCVSGTSEMGISNMLRRKLFYKKDLPVKFTALSRCYRPEVSQSAHEARLYRVHEFTKIEMFAVCEPKDSGKVLQEIVDIQCSIFDSLGLHCRLLDMPSEELGAPANRKFDVEAWLPGRNLFGELSSASDCTDFQARRLGIKYKGEDGEKRFVHTCNGTAVAVSRAIIALLETYQKACFILFTFQKL